ncbi:MAG: hypothetical protein HOY69_38685 [Streptomyces sp.]|nr:hypothetical protein [Streptomyces sp.]
MSVGAEQAHGGPTEQELQLVMTRKRATQLAAALVQDPFAPETADAARQFLADASAAVEAYAAVLCLTEPELRARIAELMSISRSRGAS